MSLLLYFAATRFLYSLFERREFGCIALELFSSSLFVAAGAACLHYSRTVLAALLIFLAYLLTAILPYLVFRRSPIESRSRNPDSEDGPAVSLGIVDTVWLTLMGATCGLILVAEQLGVIGGPPPRVGRSTEYYHAAIEETMFFLGFATNGLFATGASLGGCMAILWAGELWRKHDNRSRSEYRAQTIVSIKMVMALFVIVVAGIGWAIAPLYSRIVDLRELMRH